jgi:hypothetical protein
MEQPELVEDTLSCFSMNLTAGTCTLVAAYASSNIQCLETNHLPHGKDVVQMKNVAFAVSA